MVKEAAHTHSAAAKGKLHYFLQEGRRLLLPWQVKNTCTARLLEQSMALKISECLLSCQMQPLKALLK